MCVSQGSLAYEEVHMGNAVYRAPSPPKLLHIVLGLRPTAKIISFNYMIMAQCGR
jgi:hypothetical protein